MARLAVMTIHHSMASVAETGFVLAFVTKKSEVDALAKQIAEAGQGRCDGLVRLSKGNIEEVQVRFQSRHGWDALKAAGFDTVRAVAIDEDWTGLAVQAGGVYQGAEVENDDRCAPHGSRWGCVKATAGPSTSLRSAQDDRFFGGEALFWRRTIPGREYETLDSRYFSCLRLGVFRINFAASLRDSSIL